MTLLNEYGFNFGILAQYLNKYFKNGRMDIGRMVKIRQPNGTLRDELIDPFIPDIPCQFYFDRIDNADPLTMDVTPVIISGTIACDEGIDLLNGDLITIRQMTHNGEVMHTYKGVCGEPYVVQSRKRAEMAVRSASEAV